MFLIRWILKITGFLPAMILFLPRKIYTGSIRSTVRYKGNAVVVMNHTGFLDYLEALVLFPFRRMDVLISQSMYDYSPVFRIMLRCMGVIVVSDNTGNMESVNRAVNRLSKGHLVLVFPEGHIETTDALLKYQQGAAMIAASANAPVLPLFHNGNFGIGKRPLCFIGDEIYPADFVSKKNGLKEQADAVTKTVVDWTERFHDYYFRSFYTKKEKRPKKPKHAGFGYLFIKYTAAPLIKVFAKPEVHFENDLARASLYHEKRQIVICNHTWWLDIPIMYYLFFRRSPRSIAAKDVAEKSFAQRTMQKFMGCIFLDRYAYDWNSIKVSMQELEKEGCICTCPEGVLNFGEKLAPFQRGTAMIAAMTGTPVSPVYIYSGYRAFHPTYLIVGEPVMAEKSSDPAVIDDLNRQMEEKMEKLRRMALTIAPQEEQDIVSAQRSKLQAQVRNFGNT